MDGNISLIKLAICSNFVLWIRPCRSYFSAIVKIKFGALDLALEPSRNWLTFFQLWWWLLIFCSLLSLYLFRSTGRSLKNRKRFNNLKLYISKLGKLFWLGQKYFQIPIIILYIFYFQRGKSIINLKAFTEKIY